MPANLRLVFEHLNAVRELDRYLRKKGVDKDLEQYVKDVFCPALQERVSTLKSWHCDPNESGAKWYPDSWQIKGDLYLALCVLLPGPLSPDDPNPSVNIYVPDDRPGRSCFSDRATGCIRRLMEDGFGLAVDNDWEEEYPVGKYVYWLEPDGSFDESSLVERIASEVAKVVRLEPEITEAIHEASTKSASETSSARPKGHP
ncbi:MAG: hypothetical protein ACKV22_05905 [Bryobacteraceae bacterium]